MEKSVVYLQRRSTGEAVEAELWDDISDEHVALWRTTWLPARDELVNELSRRGVPPEQWPQDLHWKWDEKADWSRPRLALQRYALISGGALQGLMLLNLAKFARVTSQFGKDLVYVEFVATAPWNRSDFVTEPEFRSVGLNFIHAAIEVSRAESFHGRLGLLSLPQACKFYRRIGMTELGPDPKHPRLTYFEMTPEQADAFTKTHSHP